MTSPCKTIVSIGNFDGVHLGHQEILISMHKTAKKENLQSVVILFEPHPKEFFLKEVAPKRLQKLRDKITLIKNMGIDKVLCLNFSDYIANLSSQEFIEKFLKQKLNTQILVLGQDFCFGKNRNGNINTLKSTGFKVMTIPTQSHQKRRISSTWVREAVLANDFKLAETLMGHPYVISGHVTHGNKHGRLLGYPTINLPQKANIAPHGIYAVKVNLDNKIYNGVANIGHRPALNPTPFPLLEVYLFDYNEECYGKIANITFISKIREEQNFSSLEALKNQIHEDATSAKRLLNKQ